MNNQYSSQQNGMPAVQCIMCGNPKSNAGYETIYMVNNPEFQPMSNMGYPGMKENEYFFVVKILPSVTQYVMVQNNNIKSFGASRDGMLKIGVGIPRDCRLAGDKSPYDLLLDLREAFCKVNTYSEGNVIYFNAKMEREDFIYEVLSRYPLEKGSMPHRPMGGTTVATVVTDHVRELLKDIQYPEFSQFDEIVIASRCGQATSLLSVEIPRKPRYTLVVNGVQMPWSVADPYSQTSTVTGSLNQPFSSGPVSFSIKQLMANGGSMGDPTGNVHIYYDPSTETVDITEGQTIVQAMMPEPQVQFPVQPDIRQRSPWDNKALLLGISAVFALLMFIIGVGAGLFIYSHFLLKH